MRAEPGPGRVARPSLARVLAGAAAVALAPFAVAAAVAADPAPPRVQVSWIGHWLGEDRREDLVREIAREFEFLHPGVEVRLVFNKELPGTDPDHKRRAADAILRQIRGGEPLWDVVFLDVAVYEFVAEALGDRAWTRKHVVDFADVPGFLASQEDAIVNDPRHRERMGGVFTGPFVENYLQNLWYNTRVAERAGIAVKERGMTFADFLGYAERLHRFNRERGTAIPLVKLGSWNRIEALFEHLYKSRFASFAEAVGPPYDGRKAEAFLRTLEDFERLAAFPPVVNEGWERLPSDEFVRGFLLDDDALFMVGGTFMYSQFRGVSVEECGRARPVEDPVVERANGLVGDYTPVFAVMRSSRNRDLAVDLVMSWAQPRNADKWVRYTKNPTGCRSFLTDAAADAGAFGDVYERFLADMRARHRGVPVTSHRAPTYAFGPANPVSVVELRERLAAILAGKLRARDYHDDVMRRVRAASR